jgi:hypothetical protein
MSDETRAIVTSVPAQHRGRVLNPTNRLIAIGLFTLQLVLALGVCLIPAIIGGLLATGRLMPKQDLGFVPVLVGLGVTAGLLWVVMGYILRHPWSTGYLFFMARTEFLRRRDALVDPKNPEAILAEMVPRRNWGQLGGAEDLGFLLVDAERRQLLFEGDNKRYQIPAQAVTSCEVEIMNPNWDKDSRSVPVAVVAVKFRERDGLGEKETPFRPMRTVAGDPLGTNYLERAEELHRRIQSCSSAETFSYS